MASSDINTASNVKLKKALTGINGFDEITYGGIPKNRPTIICGNSGSGKTIMSMEFLINGAVKYNEPGVFMSFEETIDDLAINMESIHVDLNSLVKKKKIYIDYLDIDRSYFAEAGSYDLEGLFVRLQNGVDNIGAKRVVLDSLDALFFGLNKNILRPEIKRLFKWFKEHKITAIITSEMNSAFITDGGLEQYVADCVVALDSRVVNQITTRRLRVVKMRGSNHGNNEYPYIIDDNGMSVLPIISQVKDIVLSTKRISSGINHLDGMLDGKGFYQGSSILVSGSAGTGKTSIAISLIYASCKRKMRSLYCAFEESSPQIVRNMTSIGLDLEPFVESGLLKFYCSRPTLQNLELHIISIKKLIDEFKPEIIVMDPVTNLMSQGINSEIRQILTDFVDFLKGTKITILFTAAITLETIKSNPSDEGISAMMDTWVLVRDVELNSERNRSIYVLKSRGMNHSTQVREFIITDNGIDLLPIYLSPEGVLKGSAKLEHTIKEERQTEIYENKLKNIKTEFQAKQKIIKSKIASLNAELDAESTYLKQLEINSDSKNATKKINEAEIIGLRNKIESSLEKSKNRNK